MKASLTEMCSVVSSKATEVYKTVAQKENERKGKVR